MSDVVMYLIVGFFAWNVFMAMFWAYVGYCDARKKVAESGAGEWKYDEEKQNVVFKVTGPTKTVEMTF